MPPPACNQGQLCCTSMWQWAGRLAGRQAGGQIGGCGDVRVVERCLANDEYLLSLCVAQTWVGNLLLFVNGYQPAGPSTHVVLTRLAQMLLTDTPAFRESRVLVFSGLSGSGKSFNADHVLMKLFHMAEKTEWLLDLRKVSKFSVFVCIQTLAASPVMSPIYNFTLNCLYCQFCWFSYPNFAHLTEAF